MWKWFLALGCACVVLLAGGFYAQRHWGPRIVFARILPVPDTVSPQLQRLMAVRAGSAWGPIPTDPAVMRKEADRGADQLAAGYDAMQERLGVTVAARQIGGVNCFVLTPSNIPPENDNRLLIHVHGGGFILYPGRSGIGEAILMAGFGHMKVISVDYRLAPEFPFPAGIDDVMAVWRAVLATAKPTTLGIFGSSSGGAMVLSVVQRAIAEHLPLPAAIAPGTPWADLTKTGDSLYTNAFVDNTIVAYSGFLQSAANAYAHGVDLNDPRVSPIHGDFHGFPPTILTSGTRDLFLSNTVRVHRKLREAGVDAELEVFEGMSHAQYMLDDQVPESREVFEEIGKFFDRHLARD